MWLEDLNFKFYFIYLFIYFFFSSTSLLLPTRDPPPSCTHAQSCNPMDCSLPGSSVHEIFQARTPEGVAISSSRRSSQFRDQICVSRVIGKQIVYHCPPHQLERPTHTQRPGNVPSGPSHNGHGPQPLLPGPFKEENKNSEGPETKNSAVSRGT